MISAYIRPFFLVLFCFLSLSFAQNEGIKLADPEPQEAPLIISSPDISTSYVFPQFIDKKFPSGEEIEILLGFSNAGEQDYNVTHITASFNFPLDYSYYIQNFTTIQYMTTVVPNTQQSFAYFFVPDALLEPRDFGLVASVHYRDAEGVNYTTVFFNSTIDIIEPTGGVDTQTFFTYLGVVAVLGLIGFVIYRALLSWRKRQRIAPKEFGTREVELDDDWLTGTSADPSLRGKKKNKKNNNKKDQ